MNITESFVDKNKTYIFEYSDADSFDGLDLAFCTQCYGICFCDDKLLIASGYFGGFSRSWGYVGGRIEKGETFEQTLRREVQEESNMEIISFSPIGYQKVTNTKDGSFKYELRYVCKVKPYGPFVSDPAHGTVIEIKLINPKDYKKYVDWKKIGDRLIERALEKLPLI